MGHDHDEAASDSEAGHEHAEHGHDSDHDHSHGEHDYDAHDDHHAHDAEGVEIGVLTVSTSRTLDDDPAGNIIAAACEDAGHEIAERRLVADEMDAIEDAVADLLDDGVDVVLTTGGTGLTPDDVTVDAIEPLFDRPVPGFGELFRWLSYEEVGPMAMASRATAGVVDDRLVFCLPGSENAARTGAEKLVAPAVGHLLGLVRR
ncbi:MogA/MoaB family molybdenum cofactor biosynthesis protein [Haloarcula hispanica]|uniref:MogA/MoaB family molybdenum cofactor biosynthesis protein n=1 Tax=Haloarcula hispanica TaxID=51589 RepID=A0A482T9E9_HALHI|nr:MULTISPECIES: MogA/MoaB family molybdenum cofactor biosynthesis protein [Haloarcula]KAA9406909.1 MogA/MoaB family molybdenum cofactor biosynthesis protein [Haloarcula sp. CBA1131]MCJ0619080.1 MogA/MoaB family molybdenum cofactor biosynthesis protein [Haloarcula hispanica]RYJ09607.1 MogA/MoaB family molybdenum cofactor biosynthesis protein [Haloarcula hispanica]